MSSFKPCNPITEYDDDECEFEDGGEEVEEDSDEEVEDDCDEEVEEDDSDDGFDAEEEKKIRLRKKFHFLELDESKGS